MAGRHFLSVLGTGNYSEAEYVCDEGAVAAVYVQEAVLKLKMLKEEGYREGDRITIFVTEGSRERNWFDREYTEAERAHRKPGKDCTRREGLFSILQKEYGITEEAARLIPIGATEDELWDIFNIIYDEIQEGEALYVDITHSLRNIPVQMLSVIAYARTLKSVSVEGIYYGAFEAGKKNEDGLTEAPIFDLVTFLDILDWSQAASSFVKYGNSDEIKALFDQQRIKRGSRMQNSYKVVNALVDITQGLETSRGCYTPDRKGVSGGSVLKSYHSYEEAYKNMQKKDRKLGEEQARKDRIDPLGKLFGVINDKLSVFDVDDNLAFGHAAIEWAIENRKTQQGFTALDETIKTYLCHHYGLDEYLEQHREGICKQACRLLNDEIRKGAGNADSQEVKEKVFRKWIEGWNPDWSKEINKKGIEWSAMTEKEKEDAEKEYIEQLAKTAEDAARKLINELPCELAILSNDIGSRRNSMNHFGYSNINQYGCGKLQEDLITYYKRFRDVVQMMEHKEGGCQ